LRVHYVKSRLGMRLEGFPETKSEGR
jgi:hypothetical protein